MNRPELVTGIMLVCATASFVMARGLDVAGVPQVTGFAISVVVAGFCAFKGLQSKNRWSQGSGGVVMLYLTCLFYMLLIH